jgi:Zn-dependent protease with chaperone function
VANAMALPLTRELLFTIRLMEICDDDELSAICAHELAHLTESKGVVFLRVAGSLLWFPALFIRPIVHSFGLTGLVILPLSLGASPLVRRLSRRLEKRADRVATDQPGDTSVYARALEKLYCENQMPAVNGPHKTHPHLYDRMLAAGIQPGFQRPKPPDEVSWIYGLLWFGMVIVMGVAGSLAAAQP